MIDGTLKNLYVDVLKNKYTIRMRDVSEGWVVVLSSFHLNISGCRGAFYYLLSQNKNFYNIPKCWRVLSK